MKLTILAVSLALACVFVTTAEARPRHHIPDAGEMVGCSDPVQKPCYFGGGELTYFARGNQRKANKHRHKSPVADQKEITHQDTIIGSRPPGCPRAYCGCGASLYLFGKIIPSLNLAANWLRKFPRALPAPGMVAARRGHVFVLVRHIEGRTWLAHDSNSGRGKTRLHPRSIAGFQIVNPHGSRLALQ